VDSHRHDLEVRALFGRSTLEPRIPIERRCNFAPISKGYDQLRCGEFNRASVEVADVNFQSSHSRPPIAVRDLTASGEGYRRVHARETYIHGRGEIMKPEFSFFAPGTNMHVGGLVSFIGDVP
jgi:hypothetical protein